MTLQAWIIIVGAAAALPVWCYTAYYQLSRRPDAKSKKMRGAAVFAAIIVTTMLTGSLAGLAR